MFLLILAHPGSPGQMVVVVVVNDLSPTYLACWSSLKVKLKSQSSWSPEETRAKQLLGPWHSENQKQTEKQT